MAKKKKNTKEKGHPVDNTTRFPDWLVEQGWKLEALLVSQEITSERELLGSGDGENPGGWWAEKWGGPLQHGRGRSHLHIEKRESHPSFQDVRSQEGNWIETGFAVWEGFELAAVGQAFET